ncbi:peptidoglycan-binding protein [Rhodoblastus sp.]|uniref:peptidoglycan-binding protein n=1 Tax=Rhodoblastus sp. TaxID=1962975 RepID=UPI0035B024AA
MALVAVLAPWRAEAGGRVALVMVGEDYQKFQKSNVSAKQASDIAEALQAKGFDVLLSANPTNARARANLLDFSRKTSDADLAVAFVMGHLVAAGGQSYFLPVNTELGVSTDLFSRGISISSVAQIVGKAKAGAVIVLMTAPNFETAIAGLDARPQYATANPTSVVTVFSSSSKVSVSRIDMVSAQAADAVAKALQRPAPSLADLVKAASADVGAVFGVPAEVSLAKPSPAPESVASSGADSLQTKLETGAGGAAQNKQKGRAESERRAPDDEAQADAARLQLQQAKVELEKAKTETQRAQAEASRAEAEAAKAKAEAQAELAKAQTVTANASEQGSVAASAPIDEKLLGKRQRERIQERLRDMSLYTGPIDSIMGPLTREAIMGYQRSRGAKVTGYLTPEQFEALLPNGG